MQREEVSQLPEKFGPPWINNLWHSQLALFTALRLGREIPPLLGTCSAPAAACRGGLGQGTGRELVLTAQQKAEKSLIPYWHSHMVQSCRRSHFSNRQYPEFSWRGGGNKKLTGFQAVKPFATCSTEEDLCSYFELFTCWEERYKSAQLQMIVLFVLKSCPPAKLGNFHPVGGSRKQMRFGADHEGQCPAPGTCKLGRRFGIRTQGARESWVDHGAQMLSGLVSPKPDASRRRERRSEAPRQVGWELQRARGATTTEVT